MITYALADKRDFAAIARLLEINDLPFSDIQENDIDFIIAKNGQQIIGCIGLEKNGSEGLLRSFAVDYNFQNNGFGRELYNRLLAYGVQHGIKTLHLLTTTAKDYFMKVGFRLDSRSNAPKIIQKSKEFSSLCPSSSTYMVLEKISERVYYFDHTLLKTHTDEQTQSLYQVVKGEKMMFTHFTVPAGATFEKHSHNSEQITYILDGELIFEMRNITYHLIKGDTIVVPSDVEHSVFSEIGAIAIDAWTPFNDKY
jgi:amino-acid N-acetyltransferase